MSCHPAAIDCARAEGDDRVCLLGRLDQMLIARLAGNAKRIARPSR